MKYILGTEEPFVLKTNTDEIDLTNAIVGITDNSSATTVSNGIVNLGNTVKSNTTGTQLWLGGQAQYDSIVDKDPNTLYFITEATP